MQESIRWPSPQAKVTETSQRFGEKSQVQNVIRTIDGCHIQINAPMQKPQVYYNRKQLINNFLGLFYFKILIIIYGQETRASPMMPQFHACQTLTNLSMLKFPDSAFHFMQW